MCSVRPIRNIGPRNGHGMGPRAGSDGGSGDCTRGAAPDRHPTRARRTSHAYGSGCPKTNDCGQSSQICSKYSLLDCGRRAINGHWFRTESRQCPAASPASGFHHPAKPRRTRSQEIEAARVRGRPAPRRLRDRVRAVLLTVSSGRQIFGRPRCTGTGSTPLVTGQIPGQSGPRRLLVFRKNVPKNR
jgi:hypothetical protein